MTHASLVHLVVFIVQFHGKALVILILSADFFNQLQSKKHDLMHKGNTHKIHKHQLDKQYLRVCVYSNSRNDVPRVAQRYGTIATHTRRRVSVLVVFVVFCVHMCSFADLIRRTPPPMFSDTAITDRHSDTTNFQLRAHWVRIS